MAKLLKDPYPGKWDWEQGDDFNEHLNRTRKMLEKIPMKISFSRGDGRAYYAVKSIEPPILQWIPYGDAYQVEAALIRGLDSDDIQISLNADKAFEKIFSGK